MKTNIYASILSAKSKGQKQFAVLIDPDKMPNAEFLEKAVAAGVDYFFIGGSLLTNGNLTYCIDFVKKRTTIPVILFPGNILQIDSSADALLLLSLISGRNADMLIGKHVIAAPLLKTSGLEVLPTGYMLIESGNQTTVSYMSNTLPIPADKDDIAMCTAMAGEMLGLKMIYMDAGSGAKNAISETMIKKVRSSISVPLIIGGGINTAEGVQKACDSGADLVVIGTALEKDINLVDKLAKVFQN
ncbi:MAG TPA: geranylgeranylglyceryl/heptaprenylglyceryl phosphate synthase [Bacteroidia bacterium]|nr:geranylgeranylglyceryl/heptaprenylglyceryl phosphate synthase [Bacteroidia bacterium]HRH08041.1 geranylgeranylglyceryl/heptaprenylglyceryl phosphate synthase [Bacteroidia bacterium]